MPPIVQSLKVAARALSRRPGYALAVIGLLALGIGASTSVFSVIEASLLRPLPFGDPDGLYRIRSRQSFPDLKDLMEGVGSLESIGGYNAWQLEVSREGIAQRQAAAIVTGELFPLLGVDPIRGRLLEPADNVPGAPRVAVVSHGYWQRRFGGEPVIGKTIAALDGAYEIVGVLPDGFRLPGTEAEVFVPQFVAAPDTAQSRGVHMLISTTRLSGNATLAAAQQELDAVASRLESLFPEQNTGRRYLLTPWRAQIGEEQRPALLALLASVGLLLLVACVNVANLMMTRALDQERELAVQSALGAGFRHILMQQLSESLIVCGAGAVAGLVLAAAANRAVELAAPADALWAGQLELNSSVLLFSISLASLTAFVFSWIPASLSRRLSVRGGWQRHVSRASSSGRARAVLVIAETATAFALLAGAGLLFRSGLNLAASELGFDEAGLIGFDVMLSYDESSPYRSIPRRIVYFGQAVETLRSSPGIRRVELSTELPFGGGSVHHNLSIEGVRMDPGTEPEIAYRGVSDGYFDLMGIPLVRGRAFGEADREGSLPVAIINETMATRWFGTEDPLRRRIRWARRDEPRWLTIVGVAGDIRGRGVDQDEVDAVYIPFRQEQDSWRTWMNFVIQPERAQTELDSGIRERMARLDPGVAVGTLVALEELVYRSGDERRFRAWLVWFFALTALGLAASGIFAAFSLMVQQRRLEWGLRIALGEKPRSLVRRILSRSLALSSMGLVAGVAVFYLFGGLLESLVYGITVDDPATHALTAGAVMLVAVVATLVPAIRASRVKPDVVLRNT